MDGGTEELREDLLMPLETTINTKKSNVKIWVEPVNPLSLLTTVLSRSGEMG